MKISNSTPNYINQTYANNGVSAANTNPKAGKAAEESLTDSINLSSKTLDLQKISKAGEVQPEERAQKIAALKESVLQNQYRVDPDKVADKLLGNLMDEMI